MPPDSVVTWGGIGMISMYSFACLPRACAFLMNSPKRMRSSRRQVKKGALVKINAMGGNTLVYYPPYHTGSSFTVPDDVTTVGAYSLSYNPDLTSVDLNKTVTAESNGVNELHNLITLGIPASVTKIEGLTNKCEKISYYNVDEANQTYASIDGIVFSKDKTKIVLYPPARPDTEYTIPEGITTIGEKAFYDCPNLTNVVIPQKVTMISARAFGLDKNLNSIALLCDQMLSPDNIDQTTNGMSFDDGTNGQSGVVTNMYQNITLYVRKDLVGQYKANAFYQKFKAIKTSFTVEHPGETDEAHTDEFLPVSQKSVMLLSTKSTLPVYVAPTEVVNSGDDDEKGYTRTVSMVDNYAFENADKIKEVVFKNSIYSIGTLAFYSKTQTVDGVVTPVSTSIQDIVFCGNSAPEVLMSDEYELIDHYREFAPDQKIYVKKSKLKDYQEALSRFKDQVSYKLPGIKISSTYGTFCREFDTDLSDFYTENGNANVAAFVAGQYKTRTNAEGQTENYVHMTSIDVNGGYTADGKNTYGYIPANTGVLLKVLDQDSTPDGFYYTIGEHDDATYTINNNLMHGVTIQGTDIEASENNPFYIMQGGAFHKVTSMGKNFPVHRAYLKLPSSADAKAPLVIGFDNGETTGVSEVKTAKTTYDAWYNLQGQRVTRTQRGVYIHNGKKVLMSYE